jgi:hypothetical protein
MVSHLGLEGVDDVIAKALASDPFRTACDGGGNGGQEFPHPLDQRLGV